MTTTTPTADLLPTDLHPTDLHPTDPAAPGHDPAARADAVFARLAGDGAGAPPWAGLAGDADAVAAAARFGVGEVLGRDGLDLRTREVVTVALLAALGDCVPQLTFHAQAAVRCGATPRELFEAVGQVAVYQGVPRAINAVAVLRAALADT